MSVEFDVGHRARRHPRGDRRHPLRAEPRRRAWWRRPATRARTRRSPTRRARPQVISVGAHHRAGAASPTTRTPAAASTSWRRAAAGRGAVDNDCDRANCDPATPGPAHLPGDALGDVRTSGLVGFEGTSFSAPHVIAPRLRCSSRASESAAKPSPEAVDGAPRGDRARPRAPTGYDTRYGAGLLDAAAALAPLSYLSVVPDDHHAAGSVMGDLVRHAAEQEPLGAADMPLLPTMIRSAFCSSATSRIASAGSPWRAKVSTRPRPPPSSAPPRPRAWCHVLARVDHPLHVVGHLLALLTQPLAADRLVGADEVDASRRPPCASSVAWRTASSAVSEPSVPTTIEPNISSPLAASSSSAAASYARAPSLDGRRASSRMVGAWPHTLSRRGRPLGRPSGTRHPVRGPRRPRDRRHR